MGLFDRYLAKAILAATALVLLVIVFLDAFFGFIGEGKYVARIENYTYWHAFGYIALRMPGKIIEFLPTITLIGSLLGLGALASNSELTAMRAAGMSRGRIIWGGMKTGLLIGLAMLLLGEFVAPFTEVKATEYRLSNQGRTVQKDLNNFWSKQADDYIYIGHATLGLKLDNIKVFTTQAQTLLQRQDAATGIFEQGQLQLQAVQEKFFSPLAIEQKNHDLLQKKELIETDLFDVASVKPANMPMRSLHRYIDYLDDNALEASAYRKAFWKKITGPLSILVMMLLAMPFVFGNRRTGNAGARLVLGIMFGMGYYIASEMLSNLGQVYGFPVLLSAFLPLFIFSGIGLYLLHKSR